MLLSSAHRYWNARPSSCQPTRPPPARCGGTHDLRRVNCARFTAMGIRKCVFSLLLLGAAGMYAADAGLDSSIARNRMGTLVIRTAPGAKITVEQVRHEFWFGATMPGGIFSGRNTPQDIAKWKEIFISHFNAGVPEADFKWDVMERQKGQVNYAVVDNMLAWAGKEGIALRGHCIFWGVPDHVQPWLKQMNDDDFKATVAERGRTIGSRYRDRFAEYDLNNEMMHANYYEQRFGIDFIRQMAASILPEPLVYLTPVNAVRARVPMRFHPFQRGQQAFAICHQRRDVAIGVEHTPHDLSHQRPIFSRPGVRPLSPPRVALFHVSSRPAAILRWSQPAPAGANRTQPAFPRENLLQADIVLPEIVEIVFVQKTLTQPESEAGQMNLLGVVVEPDAALMRDPVVLAVNVEAIEVRIAPAHGDLNGVMEISDSLIAAQQNAAPNHRAHAPQNHLELVDANLTRFGHRNFIVSPPRPLFRFSAFALNVALILRPLPSVAPTFLCSPITTSA